MYIVLGVKPRAWYTLEKKKKTINPELQPQPSKWNSSAAKDCLCIQNTVLKIASEYRAVLLPER